MIAALGVTVAIRTLPRKSQRCLCKYIVIVDRNETEDAYRMNVVAWHQRDEHHQLSEIIIFPPIPFFTQNDRKRYLYTASRKKNNATDPSSFHIITLHPPLYIRNLSRAIKQKQKNITTYPLFLSPSAQDMVACSLVIKFIYLYKKKDKSVFG